MFEASFGRGDAVAIAAYTPDGSLLPTGMEPIQGAAGVQAFWQGAIDMGIKQLKLKSREVEELQDTAIELGTYTLLGSDGQQIDQGKYLVVWKEQNGQWRLHQDIWNTSLPAPAQ
nr:DUF4440 domain-containing protein [Hymenobacter roseosalivarius]